jgi:hypothetical protein
MNLTPRRKTLSLAALASGLVACGSGSVASTMEATASASQTATLLAAQTAAPAVTASPAPTHVELVAWCALAIGEGKPAVLTAMGQSNGHKADAYKLPGYDSVEWDSGNTILLATFKNGVATNLQAYEGAVGPQGATGLGCPAFRNN